MKARVTTFAVLLTAALVGHVMALRMSPEYQGRVREFEQGFLDFLMANSQESFQKAVPDSSADVVLVEFREEDKAEFSAWPPAPLDYIMLMKKLAPANPEVIAFVEPLRWEASDAQFIGKLRELLLPVPSVVLGFDVSTEKAESSPEQQEFVSSGLPFFRAQAGDFSQAGTTFQSVSDLPDKALRIGTEVGIARVLPVTAVKESYEALPFVVSDGSHLVPTLPAQTVSRFLRMASFNLHLRFGPGARLSLSDTHVVPLDKGGSMVLEDKPTVPKLDALMLLTPRIDDSVPDTSTDVLGKGKVVVIGIGAFAQAQARAIAQALAVPHLHRAPQWGEWAFAGAMALFSLWQFRRGRIKALLAGILLAALAAIVCMLTFQSSLWWWSPAPATVVLATTTLFCFLWPHRKRATPEPKTQDLSGVVGDAAA